jgi:UDP-glucose 4-epimerase
MKVLITGVAGFIGSNLADRLLLDGCEVIGVDNLSTGDLRFLTKASDFKNFQFHRRELTENTALDGLLDGVEIVFHLAANADVRHGLEAPRRDLEQNLIVTCHVLEAMRKANVKKIAFSSTGSVYGEAPKIPTPEDCPFPIQTSLYGASKTAAECFISAYAEGYEMKGYIFRFVSILGERYTHGHVYDFIRSLKKDPSQLTILGNGKQRKSYLYIGDCVNAILTAVNTETGRPVEVYNLGTDEYVNVDDSIAVITDFLGVSPKFSYTGGDRGWVGDNPFIFLDCSKIRSTGWRPTKNIRESVRITAKFLMDNPWVYEART